MITSPHLVKLIVLVGAIAISRPSEVFFSSRKDSAVLNDKRVTREAKKIFRETETIDLNFWSQKPKGFNFHDPDIRDLAIPIAKVLQRSYPNLTFEYICKNTQKAIVSIIHYRVFNAETKEAHIALRSALRSNKMPKASTFYCAANCGRQAQHYHHYAGYDRPNWLKVIPLCRKCHRRIHNGNRRIKLNPADIDIKNRKKFPNRG